VLLKKNFAELNILCLLWIGHTQQLYKPASYNLQQITYSQESIQRNISSDVIIHLHKPFEA
jgi:hypothetical protein